uniref:Apolipoprotein C-I n=1 Tax=Plecoglossus altivelis TaxID=61084 RepID=A0A140CXB7_PLEAT|nr:apolipoprotein C-I [Plecoglossus altivelis]AMJ50239.1 apolipoprotein C-I [Plecoglossus altivelis]
MKLAVAIAVLMLVFAAHTEAQEEEQTIEQRFATFQTQVKELTQDLAEKTKAALESIHQSDFATQSRSWFTEQFEKVKQKVEETFPKAS